MILTINGYKKMNIEGGGTYRIDQVERRFCTGSTAGCLKLSIIGGKTVFFVKGERK